jgi:hypothetical protein
LWVATQKIFLIVSHNAAGFLLLYLTIKRFSSVVGYNGRGFFPLLDTTEEVSVVEYNGEQKYNT